MSSENKNFVLPSKVPPITSTLFLEQCWVCSVYRTEYSEFEEHHVVPSHLGGNLGPTVSLCEICHTKAHKMAERLWWNKPYKPYSNPQHLERCVYLGVVICRARQQLEMQGGLNKRFKYSDTFSYEEHELLIALKNFYSLRSQGATIRYALKALAKQTF